MGLLLRILEALFDKTPFELPEPEVVTHFLLTTHECCFHTASLLLVASSELLSIRLQKACKTLSSSKSQTFFLPLFPFLSLFYFCWLLKHQVVSGFSNGLKNKSFPSLQAHSKGAFFRCATLQRGGGCAGTGSFRYANGSAG